MPEDSWFLALPAEQFRVAFGTEWYRQRPTDLAGRARSSDLLRDDS
jgi:hypothetical protein